MSVPFYSGWFSSDARRGRASFILANLCLYAAAAVAGALAALRVEVGSLWLIGAIVAGVIFCTAASYFLSEQRLRDAGLPEWLAIFVIGAWIADYYFSLPSICTVIVCVLLAIVPSRPAGPWESA